MVDALVLEASTSVCGFESHLPHQKKRAPKGAFFFWCLLRRGLPLRSMCGRNLRFPHTRPLPFCDTIRFAIETDRSCHRQGPGAEWRSGLFLCPKSAPPFQPIRTFPDQRRHSFGCLLLVCTTGFPKTALPESVPQSGTPKLFTLHYSLFPLHSPNPGLPAPLPGKAREPPSAGAEDRFPGSNAGLQNALSPARPRLPGTGSF